MDADSNDDTVYRTALYIGSFCVEDSDHSVRIQKVQHELEALQSFGKSKQVLICVSVRGIKICSLNRETVFMAHALRRVSYATCDAAHKQIAFLAREPLGEANLQYCHVFVTSTSSQAEELNRILGDAFQLAYARQRLLKLQRNGESSADLKFIPRLCDGHTPWPNERKPETNGAAALLGLLELPPPPSCPPPATEDTSQLAHCASSPELTTTTAKSPGTNDTSENRLNGSSVSSPLQHSTPSQSSMSGFSESDSLTGVAHTSTHADRNNVCNGSENLESRLHRISTPQISDMAFLRRHFLRRSEGKRSLAVTDTQPIGGSTRQPRRRPGTTLSGLFNQARHSAFFPSTTTTTIVTNNITTFSNKDHPDANARQSDPNNPRSPIGAQIPAQKPHIFVDLRTFAGGSPVVALKERLDAQAVADAKASAFAEAAAVLAAAKLASAESSNVSNNTRSSCSNSSSPKTKPTNKLTSEIYPIVSTTQHSADIAASNNSNGFRQQSIVNADSGDQSPPVPPTRLYSLGRGPHRPLPPTPGGSRLFPFRGASRNDSTDGCLNTENTEVFFPDVVECLAPTTTTTTVSGGSAASSPGGRVVPNGHTVDPTAPSLPVRNSALLGGWIQSSSGAHAPDIEIRPTGNIKGPSAVFAVSDYRTRHVDRAEARRFSHCSSSPAPNKADPSFNTTRLPSRPRERRVSVPQSTANPVPLVPGPLHVIAETCVQQPHVSHGWSQANVLPDRLPQTAAGMSTSTMSAETPTPTATPTPTPSQTPQPFGNQVVVSREDCEFLRHAPWYQALLPRELAFELLAREDIGSFIVRNSATHPDCCALSVRVPQQNNPTGITHYLIQRTPHGVRLKGLDKEWPSLRALITHLTVIPEMLPCLLRMPAHSTNPVFTQLDEPPTRPDQSLLLQTIQRGVEYSARASRSGESSTTLQSVTSLPSRPVPPSCASLSYLTSTADRDELTVNGDPAIPAAERLAPRSRSFQPPTPSNITADPAAVVRWKSHSLEVKAQSDDSEPLRRCDEDVRHSMNVRSQSYADGRCQWQQPGSMSPFDDEEDEDYQRLSDFSSIMADLKLAPDTEVTSC